MEDDSDPSTRSPSRRASMSPRAHQLSPPLAVTTHRYVCLTTPLAFSLPTHTQRVGRRSVVVYQRKLHEDLFELRMCLRSIIELHPDKLTKWMYWPLYPAMQNRLHQATPRLPRLRFPVALAAITGVVWVQTFRTIALTKSATTSAQYWL